jgi:hypothetical protein
VQRLDLESSDGIKVALFLGWKNKGRLDASNQKSPVIFNKGSSHGSTTKTQK